MEPRFSIAISELADVLGSRVREVEPLVLRGVATPEHPAGGALVWMREARPEHLIALSGVDRCLVLTAADINLPARHGGRHVILRVPNPRLAYARALQAILELQEPDTRRWRLEEGFAIAESAGAGPDVLIEPGAFVDQDVWIGGGSVIRSGARIGRYTEIGVECVVRENAVVGGWGFGFERDEGGVPVRIPHLGGVLIGNRVEIGALTTVACGTIEPTVIEDDVKINDHVHVGHNSLIRRKSIITPCAEIGARVDVGEEAYIGARSCTLEGVKIGMKAFVGLGAVVIRDVDPEQTVVGNPAHPIQRRRT